MGCPHVVRTAEAGTQDNSRRCMLVDLILCETYVRPRCHPGEGKKWACESKHCIREPVCNTAIWGGRLYMVLGP
eukprot:15347470-Ditylum_brightwellii.AAC.1